MIHSSSKKVTQWHMFFPTNKDTQTCMDHHMTIKAVHLCVWFQYHMSRRAAARLTIIMVQWKMGVSPIGSFPFLIGGWFSTEFLIVGERVTTLTRLSDCSFCWCHCCGDASFCSKRAPEKKTVGRMGIKTCIPWRKFIHHRHSHKSQCHGRSEPALVQMLPVRNIYLRLPTITKTFKPM